MSDKPLTNQEAADLLGVHKNTVVNWKRNGTIREFTRAEVLRMRREMWEQFAPATAMPSVSRCPTRGRVGEGDTLA